jgi:hypothetical protein
MGCYNPPPLKEYHPEIYERRRSTRNKEGYINQRERSESGQLNIERLLGLRCSFSFRVWMTWHLVELIMLHLPLNPLYLTTSLNARAGEEHYQVPLRC